MFDYTVIFTSANGKFGVLIKFAASPKDAISQAIEYIGNERHYTAIEVVPNI